MIKAALGRTITSALTSAWLRDARRFVNGFGRALRGGQAELHYFHDVADPYSDLTARMLPALAARYQITILPHLVPPPDQAAAPDADRLAAWARQDAAAIAPAYGLSFPGNAAPPDARRVAEGQALLAPVLGNDRFAAVAAEAGNFVWRGAGVPAGPRSDGGDVAALLAEGAALRKKLGHYLGAAFYFEGEWYWGVDRLHHLEARLAALGHDRDPGKKMLAPVHDVALDGQANAAQGRVLHLFISLRSPYSYIAVARARALAAYYGAELRLRFVLPMVMRGLPVPAAKRIYITLDTKREADRLGIAFGKICDPVGAGVERGLAVLHHAIAAGKGAEFALSFLQGVFAEGVDSTSDDGLRAMAARAGIDAASVQTALDDENWRAVAEANREEMLAQGLWGVPCFRVDDGRLVWGQDRLWLTEVDLKKS